ncbi:hypothetical protein PI125_g10128 [Phytophthora idaei]|nr:hypothetical protein PI125_g10128 [Phytophthora idaei]
MAEKAQREEEARAEALEMGAGRADREEAAAAEAAHRVNIGHARTRSETTVDLKRTRASRAQVSTKTFGPQAMGPDDEGLDEEKGDSESAEDGNDGENEDEEKNEEENVAEERSNPAVTRLKKQTQYKDVPVEKIPLVPDKRAPYQRKYISTHRWPARERSTDKRTSHNLRGTECPFQMLAQVPRKDDGSWGIAVKREVYCFQMV